MTVRAAAVAIDRLGSERFLVQQRAGAYVAGVWQETVQQPAVEAAGVVVPARGADMQRLPEGRRQAEAIRVLTRSSLRLAQGPQQADQVTYRGVRYEVEHVQRWSGVFVDAVCVRCT